MPSPEPFTKTRLLVVEGKDEEVFFKELLKYLDFPDIVDIRGSNGKDKFKGLMQAFTITSGFKNIEKIAVIRDADNNADDAFKSVTDTLKKIQLNTPKKRGEFSSEIPSVGVFIMPDNSSKGMLEDICLETVKEHEVMKCVEHFIVCTQNLNEKPKNISKAKVQAFLAAKPRIANSIGLGAQKGYWNFNSEIFRPLINFLNQLK